MRIERLSFRIVGQLVELGILAAVDPNAYTSRFSVPRLLAFLTQDRR